MTTLAKLNATRLEAMHAAEAEEEAALALIDAAADPKLDDYTDAERAARAAVIEACSAKTDAIQAEFVAAVQADPDARKQYRQQRELAAAEYDI